MSLRLESILKEQTVAASPEQVLGLPVEALAGVTVAAGRSLQALGISSVFDLATSSVFNAALAIVEAAENARGPFAIVPRIPGDALRGDQSIGVGDAPRRPVADLRLLSATQAHTLEHSLGVSTIRELAVYPPFQLARAVFSEASGGVLPDDDGIPRDLVPASGRYPTERVQYDVLVLDELLGVPRTDAVPRLPAREPSGVPVPQGPVIPGPDIPTIPGNVTPAVALPDVGTAGPIDVGDIDSTDATHSAAAVGAFLTYNQSWYTQGLALGQLLHTLALAPGESTRIAMVDWSRKTRTGITESTTQTEQLTNELERGRAIQEVTSAVARESQSGWSRTETGSTSGQVGLGGGIAGVLGEGVMGALGVSGSVASSSASAESWTSSAGERQLNSEMSQNILDRTHQAASSARNRWATVVKEVSQSESETISTRVVTNYNHMYALSIQYYEIVQIYRIAVELARVTRCLFLPMKPLDFRRPEVVTRHREALAQAALSIEIRDGLSFPTGTLRVACPSIATSVLEEADLPGTGWSSNEIARTAAVVGPLLRVTPEGALCLPDDASIIEFDLLSNELTVQTFKVTKHDGTTVLVQRAQPGFKMNLREAQEISVVTTGTATSSSKSYVRALLTLPAKSRSFSITAPLTGGAGTTRVFVSGAVDADVVSHLQDHRLYYSRAVWRALDSATITLLLSAYSYRGKPLLEVIDPTPVTCTGNYLVFRMYGSDERWEEFRRTHDLSTGVVKEDFVPLPSGGVFAEAVLGRANAAEKIDSTRFWNWQDSPIPIAPPEIAAIQAGSRSEPDTTQTGGLESPVVNIVNPPSLPDPTGLVATLSAIANGNMFRDMSGLGATASLAQAALQASALGASNAARLAASNMKTASDLFLGTAATDAAQQVAQSGQMADVLKTMLQTTAQPAPSRSTTDRQSMEDAARRLDDKERASAKAKGEPDPGFKNQKKVQGTNEPAPKQDPDTKTVILTPVEIKLRVWVPSPLVDLNDTPLTAVVVLLGGNNRGSSYEGGTSAAEVVLKFNIDLAKMKAFSVEKTSRFGRYDFYSRFDAHSPDDSAHRPSWWWEKDKPDIEPIKTPSGLSGVLDATAGRLDADVDDSGDVLRARLIMKANPLFPWGLVDRIAEVPVLGGAVSGVTKLVVPDVDADITISFARQGGQLVYMVSGTHDTFPAFEVYVNKEPSYVYEVDKQGGTPWQLVTGNSVTLTPNPKPLPPKP